MSIITAPAQRPAILDADNLPRPIAATAHVTHKATIEGKRLTLTRRAARRIKYGQ